MPLMVFFGLQPGKRYKSERVRLFPISDLGGNGLNTQILTLCVENASDTAKRIQNLEDSSYVDNGQLIIVVGGSDRTEWDKPSGAGKEALAAAIGLDDKRKKIAKKK